MKKYYVCFFILVVLLAAALLTGTCLYLYRPQPGNPIPNTVIETEPVIEDNMVINQKVEKRNTDASEENGGGSLSAAGREAAGQYCLVAEDGFLLVFARDRDTVCLDTHMPLSEFPAAEQERLMDGIWFSSMMEIFNYLESYSS